MVTDDENEDILPYEEKHKLMAAAFRKGFRQDSIRTALKNLNVDT
jgi:SOS response regulatory protein OraA/RecX